MPDTFDLPKPTCRRLKNANARVEQEIERRDAILKTVSEIAEIPPDYAGLDFENNQVVDTRTIDEE